MADTKICQDGFHIGTGARVRLYPFTINATDITSTQSVTMPTLARTEITITAADMPVPAIVPGALEPAKIAFNGNWIPDDAAQEEMEYRVYTKTPIVAEDLIIVTDTRPDTFTFWALNKNLDPCGQFNVISFTTGEMTVTGATSVTGSIGVKGAGQVYKKRTPEMTASIAEGALTATGMDFLALGFKPNMSVIIVHTGPTNTIKPIHTMIEAVAATTMSFVDDILAVTSAKIRIFGASPVITPEELGLIVN